MIAYVDSSVLLRVVLGQADALSEWPRIRRAIASRLLTIECLRTLDRLRIRKRLPDAELASRRSAALTYFASFELIDLDNNVLERAQQPMPTELGTLDAIHLASALLWREFNNEGLTVATHDRALALAAQAHGLPVVGIAN